MSESFITQCPHCGTSFRVRNEQLSVANGSVRCGACLQVFSARNHVIQADSAVAKKLAPKKSVPAAPRATPKPVLKAAPKPTPAPPPPPESEFNFTADDDEEFIFADGDDDSLFGDDDGDSLFDDDEKSDGFGELSDSFMSLNESGSSQNTHRSHFQDEAREMSQDILDDDETDDESWAESMLEEIEKENKPQASSRSAFSAKEVSAPRGQRNAPAEVRKRPNTSNILDFDEPIHVPKARPAKPSASAVVSQASSDLDVDFNAEERLNRLRPLGWLVICVLTVTLFAQLAWLQRDTYARMDQWRGLYEQACNVLGCELPAQIDVSKITTTFLLRDHKDPKLADIQIADIVLTNKAPFKQKFPEIVLQFSDASGKLVADQSFLPQDYLKGEMTGVDVMPINTRIYVSLPIKRAPRGAVSHQLVLQGAGI